MPIDCADCVKIKSNRKGMDCPVNDLYRQNHDSCEFKKTPEELEEQLDKGNKMWCPKHGWQRGWRTTRPIAGSSAPQFFFCPVKGCTVRRRGG
jgi:nitrite reductase/ring-hydroxylating ferredoxin subunit